MEKHSKWLQKNLSKRCFKKLLSKKLVLNISIGEEEDIHLKTYLKKWFNIFYIKRNYFNTLVDRYNKSELKIYVGL